ncbi:hypothetical protein [Alienimonas sp. DA493]|uniref:hypothetical protein n=1 Tax=Alienimonas sp. DA493 TaxID=3373605 RepID=UPI003754B406
MPSKSDREAERAAWEGFLTWRADIDAKGDEAKPHREDYEHATAVRLELSRWIADELNALERTGEVPESEADPERGKPDLEEWRNYLIRWRDRLAKQLQKLEREFAKVSPKPLDRPDTVFSWPFAGCEDAEERAWLRRLDTLADFRRHRPETDVPEDRTVRAAVGRYLERKATEGHKPSTLKRSSERLSEVVTFAGGDDVECINAVWLERYRSHLLSEVASTERKFSTDNAKATLDVCRTFVRHLYETEQLDRLPRNVDKIHIKAAKKKPETYPPELLKVMADAAPDRLRCWLLLLGNLGCLPVDLSDLKLSEVDAELGIVTRKRSKTEEATNVPVVSHVLWDQTLETLREQLEDRPEPLPGCEDRALLTRTGSLLKYYAEGKGKNELITVDNVRNALNQLKRKMARRSVKVPTRADRWRKTGASLLNSEAGFAELVQLWLGHAPQTVADKHYAAAPLTRLADAVAWLGERYGFDTDPDRLTEAKRRLGQIASPAS